MIARPASWSERRSSDARWAVAAAALGVVLLGCSFGLLHLGPLGRNQIIDTPVYQRYGDAVTSGLVPYRDFDLEYPPGALPVFILPALAPASDYRAVFELEMALCAAATVLLVVATLRSVGASGGRLLGAAAFVGLAPLALGPVILTRFDLWPVLLTAAALAALVSGRHRLGAAALALGAVAKIYPLVLLPLALVYVGRRRGAREAGVWLALFVAVAAAVLVPFAILAPHGLVDSFERQTGRPLQIESLASGFLLVAHQVGSYLPRVVSSYGSQNLDGSLPDTAAATLTALQAVAVVAVWLLFARRRGRREELLAACAAAVAAFVTFGKVLSPQFLIWLVPLVPLVAGGVGLAASGALLVALVLTHLWFPSRYWDLVALEGGPAWLVLARDVSLVALTVLLAVAIRRVSGRPRSA